MESPQKSHNLFEVYLRLRPPPPGTDQAERILHVEEPEDNSHPSHITLNPPADRRRAIEKFGFTQVFEEEASQLDVFHCTEVLSLVEGVLAPQGGEGTDAVVATLGVTGSGKTHTILGSRSQRGLTQLAMDVLFRSIGENMLEPSSLSSAFESLQAYDSSEASLVAAPNYFDAMNPDYAQSVRSNSQAPASMLVRPHPIPSFVKPTTQARPPPQSQRKIPCTFPDSASPSPRSIRLECSIQLDQPSPGITRSNTTTSILHTLKRVTEKPFMSLTAASRLKTTAKHELKGDYSILSTSGTRRTLPNLSILPQSPDVSNIDVSCDPSAEYVVIVSMYEVHNDRIYDLLTPASKSTATKEFRRRPLLFKSTELSPDRKVVAGLRKVICTNFGEALMVLETGLQERRVSGTGSNSTSSRSHGFFCFEVKKKTISRRVASWSGSKLTIVDLAGSERAREAKTHGATLAEAGKINESLMYLGQCLQTQSEVGASGKPNLVPYRQCKLTELLFSNSFPSQSTAAYPHVPHRNPQKGVMIVTADPIGDFNATSQILRYSALAREVAVPRIPSIASTILSSRPTTPNVRPISPVHPPQHQMQLQHHPRHFFSHAGVTIRNHTPPANATDERVTMELAALEIARLSDEIDHLRDEVEMQTEARITAEAHLLSMEDRMIDLEAAIREDCAVEFEQRLALELARFKTSMQLEKERNEEHWDRKVDLLERGLDLGDEDGDKENVLVENLHQEVDRLRRDNGVLKRELASRSPTKRKPLEDREDFSSVTGGKASASTQEGVSNLGRKLERMRVSNTDNVRTPTAGGSSPKKMRKLGKRWDDLDDY
ncbi:Kinesin-like motor protein 9 [Cladobotryum mycophilum]|uniref:Kinesin-like protein n=1 Tax=Cladobotryum mycophilum TaxID=491253 RepID=A0ABR0SXH3_9HYPO